MYDSGSAIGATSDGKLPNITGSVDLTGQGNTTTPRFNANDAVGSALYNNESITVGRYHTDSGSGAGYNRIKIDASRSSSVYMNEQTSVVPANVNCFWCIKF